MTAGLKLDVKNRRIGKTTREKQDKQESKTRKGYELDKT
jgi:hypothetical protein